MNVLNDLRVDSDGQQTRQDMMAAIDEAVRMQGEQDWAGAKLWYFRAQQAANILAPLDLMSDSAHRSGIEKGLVRADAGMLAAEKGDAAAAEADGADAKPAGAADAPASAEDRFAGAWLQRRRANSGSVWASGDHKGTGCCSTGAPGLFCCFGRAARDEHNIGDLFSKQEDVEDDDDDDDDDPFAISDAEFGRTPSTQSSGRDAELDLSSYRGSTHWLQSTPSADELEMAAHDIA